jgi:putative DNA methylase
MIERWFPCAEVSDASMSGWGSGKSEKALFTWFAARPLAQAKAAVLTSLLPWPESEAEQGRLQQLVRDAMTGRDVHNAELVAELNKAHPDGASVLDVFSGRAMIPLEAARLGLEAHGVDYSPVATLAGALLADYPLRDWTGEPPLPYSESAAEIREARLLDDATVFLAEVGSRYERAVADLYPKVGGKQPWGYLWATSLPCQDCGRRFPLTGNLVLRHPLVSKNDSGQSYRLDVDRDAGTVQVVVHEGPPTGQPTLINKNRDGKAVKGKSAICPFCSHVHPKQVHQRLAQDGLGEDILLVAADLDPVVGKHFRQPTKAERAAVDAAEKALRNEEPFGWLPAVPDEAIPVGNSDTVRASIYGARTYGDLCNARQTLAFVRLARVIADTAEELKRDHGISDDYAAALAGYASSVLVRKLKYSTRGAPLQSMLYPTSNRIAVKHIFRNEASLSHSYDYFETGLGDGPGTWPSLADDTVAVLKNMAARSSGRPADLQRGSAMSLPFPDGSLSAVVTDPPYDNMIDYSDASDLFYVWLKRAMHTTAPWFSFTAHELGVQEKAEEIIVKRFRAWKTDTDHRTREHYDTSIAKAFTEARRVVRPDGVVTIVFGHGDPEVWHRLLAAVTQAGLVLTGSWPAKTEAGGSAGSANIVTTLTMSCRPAPEGRPSGDAAEVEHLVRHEVANRLPIWERAGLAPTDQLMASAGPAMEVVGRYSAVKDHRGRPVDPAEFLVIARRAVEEAAAVEIDHLPLETFDARTRFALSWTRLFGRGLAPKSEARWQALAADLEMADLKGVLTDDSKGSRLCYAREHRLPLSDTSAVIDVALGMARAWDDGLQSVAEVLTEASREPDDPYLWAAVTYLASKLPAADPDAQAWTGLLRTRTGLGSVARGVAQARLAANKDRVGQRSLFEIEGSGDGL